jgi:hypothetical protein
MEKRAIVVSRKWKDLTIEAFMNNEEVGAKTALTPFMKAVADQMGSPTFVMTRAQLLQKLLDATEVVLKELKDGTRYV